MSVVPVIPINWNAKQGRPLIESARILSGEIRPMRLSAAMVENIRLRVSPEEKRALRAAARQRGLSLSDFIRQLASQVTGIAA
ncbi:DUF1778 domain-containing protein [Mesorhizobium sp. AR10]|nr:DUF1778 domain-containing protein [Mesorhizobium sp. AR10]